MAIGNETFNNELYQLLKVRGYHPTPLNSRNQRVKASQEADVIEFDFTKDGESYGKAWISIDDASNVCVYFDDEQAESPSNATPGAEYDDTWTGLLKHLKQWAQRRQLSFELANKDRLGDDMRQRDYYKMKEKLGESYHAMGKKASWNDAVPNVKIVLQHNRSLEEGEARFRNVARIYLENVDGERFLAPTNKPGLARVYARHIAEGGVPNDEKWNHIKSICEEYQQMAGFVRATRKGQFNESAQQLVNEGINHYNNLRETLHKLAGHRGYHAYFESYTPALMEDDTDDSINELFVQETMDPRIESVMPILSRLHKKVSEGSKVNVDSLAEWADTVISEKLELDAKQPEEKPAEKAKDKDHQELIDFYTKKYGEKDGRKKADRVYALQNKKKSRDTSDDKDDYSAKDTKLQKYEKKANKKLSKKRVASEGEVVPFKQNIEANHDEMNYSKDPKNRYYVVDFTLNKLILTTNDLEEAKQEAAEWAEHDDLETAVMDSKTGKQVIQFDGFSDAVEYLEGGDDDSWIPSEEEFEHEEELRNRKHKPANDLNEMDKEHGSRRDFDNARGPDKTGKPISAKMMAKKALKSLNRGMKGWEKGMHDVDSVKAATKSLSPDQKEKALGAKVSKGSPAELQQKLIKREKNKSVDEATGYYSEKHPKHDQMTKDGYEHSIEDILGDKLHRYFKPGVSLTDLYKYDDDGEASPREKVRAQARTKKVNVEVTDKGAVYVNGTRITGRGTKWGVQNTVFQAKVPLDQVVQTLRDNGFGDIKLDPQYSMEMGIQLEEDLGPEQKRVGQLGPTEKVKNNNIGKLVGASESTEIDPELARIIEMARFKR